MQAQLTTTQRGTRPGPIAGGLITVSGYLALVVGLIWFFAHVQPKLERAAFTYAVYTPANVQALAERFRELDYHWPPGSDARVPRLMVTQFPPDLEKVDDIERKKSLFLRAVLPLVLLENERIAGLRAQLRHILAGALPEQGQPSRFWLDMIARRYQVPGSLEKRTVRERLLQRVDAIPPGLVLAQAAIESGWGTSRFAQEGNALFGQWTWGEHAGLVPKRRQVGAEHRVRAFDTLRGSIRAYFRNLNSNGVYEPFRRLRSELRTDGQPLDPLRLAEGLDHYSGRGEAYIEDVQAVIRQNKLHQLRRMRLREGPPTGQDAATDQAEASH